MALIFGLHMMQPFASRLRYELASLRSEPAADQIHKLSREEAHIIEEANRGEWKDERRTPWTFAKRLSHGT